MYRILYKVKTTSVETRCATVNQSEFERLIALDTDTLINELEGYFSDDLDEDEVVDAQPIHLIEAIDGSSRKILLDTQPAHEPLAKLPAICLAYLPQNRKPIIITRGEPGYRLLDENQSDVTPEAYNEDRAITPAQVNAMMHGSLFGWDTPGADPDCAINQKIDPYRKCS